MKKIKLIIFGIFFFIALLMTYDIYSDYYTPEKKLEIKAIKEIKEQMNDPSSFELISFERNYDKLNNSSIDKEFFKIIFRGKNKIGALIIDEAYIEASRYSKSSTSEYFIIDITKD